MNRIGYCDRTVNVITGCLQQLPCRERCWARRMSLRLAGNRIVKDREKYDGFRPAFWPERLQQLQGEGETIAVNFMGDMFGPAVDVTWIRHCLMVMMEENGQRFLLLTKNPEMMVEIAKRDPLGKAASKMGNIWWGVSVSTQKETSRIDTLAFGLPQETRKWVSAEPLLESVELTSYVRLRLIHWVVGGLETGAGRRPGKEEWLRDMMVTCHEGRVPFWWKGAGKRWQEKGW